MKQKLEYDGENVALLDNMMENIALLKTNIHYVTVSHVVGNSVYTHPPSISSNNNCEKKEFLFLVLQKLKIKKST